MDFFKSMLSDDPEPEILDTYGKSDADRGSNQSPTHQRNERLEEERSNLTSSTSREFGSGGGSLWSFGDIVKTLTTRSESVLETYRRDLKEFGSGLKKESNLFREVASRAVKELPTSIEAGASAFDGVLKSTADIISQGKGTLLDENISDRSGLNSRGYSRFDSQLSSIQNDARTYCEDPEDLDDYNNWKLGFLLSDKESEIEKVIGDNGSVESIYRKVVPNEVDDESFWCRYFYRVHKLKQQEDTRANLVWKSLAVDEEEELSWDVDEGEEEKIDLPGIIEKKRSSNHESKTISSDVGVDDLEKNTNAAAIVNKNTEDSKPSADVSDLKVKAKSEEQCDRSEISSKDGVEDLEKKTKVEEPKPSGGDVCDEKVESVPTTKEILSIRVSLQEEDLEWDEIGDLGDNDEKEVISQVDTTSKGDVFKHLSTADDDEDLSWDIEDDDEPIKGSSNQVNLTWLYGKILLQNSVTMGCKWLMLEPVVESALRFCWGWKCRKVSCLCTRG